MGFRATFIGTNKHSDPGIPELTGAARDASALHALFSDTFSDIRSTLLLDEAATLDAIRAALDECLGQASEDDVVVLTFAGHGTPGHQIVAYDTDRDSPGDTTLPMDELAARFQSSKARAVLCIIDCCFSGAAPARVLEGLPTSRADLADFSAFKGKGRFLLAAASPTQPAWEEPTSGHGLLTRAIIEVFTSREGPLNLTEAVGLVIVRTRELAEQIGEQQDACFVGGSEGALELPVLKQAAAWRKLFPDLSTITVTKDLDQLTMLGVPTDIIAQWQGRFPDGLNQLQLAAVNRHRVLAGNSLLVVAPTSSGKTFIGEISAVRAAVSGSKAVFLLPYRALVNEKYEDFLATYGPAGLRVVRCSGDFTDQTGLFLSGRHDIAILTYEMFLGLAVSTQGVLKHHGLVVLDGAQFITDPTRGIAVELLLTLILAGRSRGIRPQIIALSAVIGDVNGFDEWLGCDRLTWTHRPVPLTEGVLDRSGVYQALDPQGVESETQLLPCHAIQQRRDEPSAQDVIVPLVRSLVQANGKVLVFRNTRGPAEGCARYLAQELRLLPAQAALDALPTLDLSTSAGTLRQCLAGGTAFHNANLTRDERVVIERGFRSPTGGIHALAATTTLAAGINTPASTVILAEQEFVGEDGRPFNVAEYKNMAGRAGRLGYNETGKSIILADNAMQRRQLFARYVRGTPEPIASSFTDHDLRTWIIRLLSQVKVVSEAEVPHLLASTYGGFLSQKLGSSVVQETEKRIARDVAEFVRLGLLERLGDKVQLSLLGRACGQSSLSFDSAMRLIETVRNMAASELSPFNLVGLLQILPEADRLFTPIRKRSRIESARIADATSLFGHGIVRALQTWVSDEFAFWGRCKRAAILGDWMNGATVQPIERRYSVPFGGQIQNGDIQRYADSTRFHLQSAHQILSALLAMDPAKEQEFDAVISQLEFGVPPELMVLIRAPFSLSRGECLALSDRGIRSPLALASAQAELLNEILGKARATRIQKVCAGDEGLANAAA
jgi:helicase